MDPILSMLKTAVVETLGELAPGLAILSALLVLLVAGMGLASRRTNRGRLQLRFHGGSAPGAGAPSPGLRVRGAALAPRHSPLDALGAASASIAALYIRLLYAAMGLATFVLGFLYFKHPDDGNRGFMLLYGGVLYVVAMLALSSQVGKARQRQRVRSGECGMGSAE